MEEKERRRCIKPEKKAKAEAKKHRRVSRGRKEEETQQQKTMQNQKRDMNLLTVTEVGGKRK